MQKDCFSQGIIQTHSLSLQHKITQPRNNFTAQFYQIYKIAFGLHRVISKASLISTQYEQVLDPTLKPILYPAILWPLCTVVPWWIDKGGKSLKATAFTYMLVLAFKIFYLAMCPEAHSGCPWIRLQLPGSNSSSHSS